MKKDNIETTEESLAIITQMIRQTQRNLRGDSFYFILWGWVGFVGFMAHYLLQTQTSYEHPYLVWLIAIPAWVLSFVHGFRSSRSRGVSNYSDKMVMWTWIAYGITIILVIFSGRFNALIPPVIIALAAMATFITGCLIRYKPLIYGAGSLWIFAAIALAVSPVNSLLVCAAAIVCGYLVPGYLLRKSL